MPSGKALLLIFIVFAVLSFTAWYLSPIGDWIKRKLLNNREKLSAKLKAKKEEEDGYFLY